MPNPITPGRPLRLYTNHSHFTDVSTDSLVGAKKNKFKNWLCSLGTQNLYVDMDGKVFGASCRVGGSFGNIYSEINPPVTWLKCTKNACSCGADLFVPKVADASSQRLLVNTLGPDKTLEPLSDNPTIPDFVAMEPSDPIQSKQVYWEIGRRCNFDCYYCFPGIHNKTDPHKSLEDLIKATLLVEERFCKNQSTHFVISGGEPTINPALLDWVRFLYSLGHRVSMHSNGSRNPDYYLELIRYTNLNISVHFDFYQPERLLKTLNKITQKKIDTENRNIGHLEVKLMMPPNKVEEALWFEKEICKIPQFSNFSTRAIVPIREGDYGELIAEGYKESDFSLFGDRL